MLLATVSPLAANMAETLTTLRFAHRAKSIVNMAVVNTAPPGLLRGGNAPTAADVLESKASEEGCVYCTCTAMGHGCEISINHAHHTS